jgi:hypothetical protein
MTRRSERHAVPSSPSRFTNSASIPDVIPVAVTPKRAIASAASAGSKRSATTCASPMCRNGKLPIRPVPCRSCCTVSITSPSPDQPPP